MKNTCSIPPHSAIGANGVRPSPGVASLVVMSSLGLFSASGTYASTIEFGGTDGFEWTSPYIEKNGTAHAVNTAGGQVLRLTDDVGSEAGSAFSINPYIIGGNTDFTSSFKFRITSNDPLKPISDRSDGLAFIIGRSPAALGEAGGGLGYGGISPSVIIEFDTYSNALFTDPNDKGSVPNASHVALMTKGDKTNHLISRPTSAPMDNGHEWEAWISYFGQGDLLIVNLTDLEQPSVTANFSYGIDIPEIMGCGSAGCFDSYFGFTAGTGGGSANHDVVSWKLYVPEPGSLPLFAVGGLAALCLRGKSARRR